MKTQFFEPFQKCHIWHPLKAKFISLVPFNGFLKTTIFTENHDPDVESFEKFLESLFWLARRFFWLVLIGGIALIGEFEFDLFCWSWPEERNHSKLRHIKLRQTRHLIISSGVYFEAINHKPECATFQSAVTHSQVSLSHYWKMRQGHPYALEFKTSFI